MEKKQAIQYIQQQIDKIDIDKFTIGPDRDKYFNVWKKEMLLCVGDIYGYGKDSQRYIDIEFIKYGLRSLDRNGNLNNNISQRKLGLEEAKLLLEGYIKNIKENGLPNGKNIYSNDKQLEQPQIINNIHNTNNQTQEVNTNIIVQNIFEGLNDSEREALKKILQQYNKDQDKNNLIQSLHSFGKGVLENIIANIITNPRLINQIINTLL